MVNHSGTASIAMHFKNWFVICRKKTQMRKGQETSVGVQTGHLTVSEDNTISNFIII